MAISIFQVFKSLPAALIQKFSLESRVGLCFGKLIYLLLFTGEPIVFPHLHGNPARNNFKIFITIIITIIVLNHYLL